jgi:hypothetical protein
LINNYYAKVRYVSSFVNRQYWGAQSTGYA